MKIPLRPYFFRLSFLLALLLLVSAGGRGATSLSIPGEESMETLRKQCEEAFTRRDYSASRKTGLILLEEADATGNQYYKGYGNYYVGASEIFAGNSSEGRQRLESARKIAEATGNDSLTGMCLNSLGIFEATCKLLSRTDLLPQLRPRRKLSGIRDVAP